jgi:predicted  nucleic acid-binding Zn-ribbon protein
MDSPTVPGRTYQRPDMQTNYSGNAGVIVPEKAEVVMVSSPSLDYTVHAPQTGNGTTVNLESLNDLMNEMEGVVNARRDDMEDRTVSGGSSGFTSPQSISQRSLAQNVMRNGHTRTDSNMQRMKDSYELQIKMLQQQVQDLEQRLAAMMDDSAANRLRALEDELASAQELNNRLQADYQRLQDSYDQLKQEYEEQRVNSNNLKEETQALIASIQELAQKNDEIALEREEYEETIREMSAENKRLRQQLEDARREVRAIKATSAYAREHPQSEFAEPGLLTPTNDGVLESSRIPTFQLSIDSLLRAVRTETANQCLIAMKSVVMACKGILQDIDVYQHSNRPGPDRGQIPELKSRLGSSLNVLVTTVRNHATARGVSPAGLVDAAASDVTGVVVDISIQQRDSRQASVDRGYPASRFSSTSHSRQASVQSGSKQTSQSDQATAHNIEQLKASNYETSL